MEAGIDGKALLELVGDFEEFSALVPIPLVRLRIKKFIRESVCNAREEVTKQVGLLLSVCMLNNFML